MGLKPRKRTPPPADWADFLDGLVVEMEMAVEIVRRLRRAAELEGLRPADELTLYFCARRPPRDRTALDLFDGVESRRQRLKSPGEIAESIPNDELLRLLDEWEEEVESFARPLWDKLADRVRLRQERWDLVRWLNLWRDIPRTEIFELLDETSSRPGEMVSSRSGRVTMARVYEYVREPWRALTDEDLEELAEEPKDIRHYRRLVDDPPKKARGGVLDIDPRLLRSK